MKNYKVVVRTDVINLGFVLQALTEDVAAGDGIDRALEFGVDIDEIQDVTVIPW